MVIQCERCQREFNAKPSAIKKGKKYCSKECFDQAQFKGEVKQCYECGKEIKVSPSLIRERNFCSNECRRIWISKHMKTEVNIPGHSKGHKAPHLSALNIWRNPLLALEPDAIARGTYKTKEHRKEMEKIIGRKLKRSEDVHHKNGIHDDNSPDNLEVMEHREHMRLHWKLAKERGVI